MDAAELCSRPAEPWPAPSPSTELCESVPLLAPPVCRLHETAKIILLCLGLDAQSVS